MKPLKVGVQLSVVVGLLIASYYLGRPLYWEMQSRFPEAFRLPSQFSSAPSDPTGSDLIVGLSAPETNTSIEDQSKKNNEHGIEPSVKGSASLPLHEALQKPIWEAPPAGSKFPPREAFALRKELVEFRAKKNVIAVTFANHAFMGFVLSWVKSLTDDGVTNLLVGAMDTELLEDLYWRGIPVFDMGSNMKTFDVGWGTAQFHKMGREKVILVNAFLSLGYELLMCDTDMVWLKNPLPYLERYPAADVLTSSDEVVNSVDDDSLEIWDRSFGAYNIGIVHWRPTAAAKAMAAEWKEQLLADDLIWDQNGFNELMKKKLGPSVQDDSKLVYAYDGTLKLGILPVSIFCSGHTYFVQAQYKRLKLQPYAVHTTFQFAGTEGKRHRLREVKLFLDEPHYYDVPGGLLSYRPSLPDDLMKGGEHSVETHFALVNHQLIQVRNALAVASTLNRTLVMPELWCRFDRLWFGHPGVLVGTITPQPFLCPMDHVFEVNVMLKNHDDAEFGTNIRFREYSFLENRRLPSKVKDSTLKVDLCEKDTLGCSGEADKVTVPGHLQLPMNATEIEIKRALSPYQDAEVIEFSSMLGAFGGFSDKSTEEKFRRRLKTYTGIWCCVQDKVPGHIYYDFYWDEKPNWRPEPPETQADDHPPW